eukprot:2363043-Rhodomonas_salina.3
MSGTDLAYVDTREALDESSILIPTGKGILLRIRCTMPGTNSIAYAATSWTALPLSIREQPERAVLRVRYNGPVLTQCTAYTAYAMPGTDLAYGAMCLRS